MIHKLTRTFRRACWALAGAALVLGCASEHEETDARASNTDSAPDALAAPVASASTTLGATAASTTLGATAASTTLGATAADTTLAAAAAPPARATGPRCREQSAQDFLLRKGQIAKIGASAEERQAIEAARRRSIEYRTRQYGRVSGFGRRADNPHPPSYHAERTTFMGVPLVLNRKVVPALRCVEAALLRDCAAHPYRPRQVGGLRSDNTFVDYEISNHVYGIALDIDPQANPCCGCVGFWNRQAVCRKKVGSPFERMAMPPCWVEVFERHGFHWLGHDELEDTMHFDFLGDPDRILE